MLVIDRVHETNYCAGLFLQDYQVQKEVTLLDSDSKLNITGKYCFMILNLLTYLYYLLCDFLCTF